MRQDTAPSITAADRLNSKIEHRILKEDFLSTLESAYAKYQTTLNTPLIKRVYLRFFDATQLNVHWICVYGRIALTDQQVVQVEAALRKHLDELDAYLQEKLKECALLFENNGLTSGPCHLAPMTFEARVISPLSRKFLASMVKADQVVGMIELLVIEDIVSTSRAEMLFSEVRNRLRRVAIAARTLALGVRKMSSIAQSKATAGKVNGEDAPVSIEAIKSGPSAPPAAQTDAEGDVLSHAAALAAGQRRADRARRKAGKALLEADEAQRPQ